MPSRICCPDNHPSKGTSFHEAAIALSQGQSIGVCKKCGKELQYRINYTYPNDPSKKEYSFLVTRAVRLGAQRAGNQSHDACLLVLRDIKTGNEQILPTLWGYGQNTILNLDEWQTLFRRLDASFWESEERIRVRAYELYKRRGQQDGHALDDWLQAETELTERKSLRATG